MSSTHPLRVHDACPRTVTRTNVLDEDTSPGMTTGETSSPPDKELGTGSGSGVDAPRASPTRPDSPRPLRLQPSVRREPGVIPSCWKDPDGTNVSSPSLLQSTYGLWCTCAYDGDDSKAPLPLAPSLDGDIFGVGKRPVQREIEIDGCVRLVFVEE